MIVGCYSMDLYCDDPEHNRIYGWNQHQWTGETEHECLKYARLDGWKFDLKASPKLAFCPVCVELNKRNKK